MDMRICAMAETWILYRTTNLLNFKIYVGVHKVADTTRSKKYLGSGDQIRAAIKKYGRENFIRETLAEFSSCADVYDAEAKLVNQEFVNRDDTYNICLGGRGGVNLTEEMKNKLRIANTGKKASPEAIAKMIKSRTGQVRTEESKARMKAAQTGKVLSEATKAKISAAAKGRKGRKISDEEKSRLIALNSKPVVINRKYYTSAKKASEIKKLTYETVQYRLKSPNHRWSKWRYATDEEKAAYALGEVQ
jgi:group I intron endonuclease